jgi:hypothetical protein
MAVDVAKGIHDSPQFKLGSIIGKGLDDDRTIKMEAFIGKDIVVPASWDFDKNRKKFPVHVWGNDEWGDCELAGRANYMLRLARAQSKTTPALSDQDVIDLYKVMTGAQTPGDNNDSGLYTLDNLRQWRTGWDITKDWPTGGHGTRKYQIAAFGYIDPKNRELVRKASYLFNGILYGVELPIIAQQQINSRVFDVDASAGSAGAPGSWGGHMMYSKRFDPANVHMLTWGMQVQATDAWIDEYAVEAWVVVNTFETWWKFKHLFDAEAMIKKMRDSGITVQQ